MHVAHARAFPCLAGAPTELLKSPNGSFAALVAQTGTKNAEHLRKLAANKSSGALAAMA